MTVFIVKSRTTKTVKFASTSYTETASWFKENLKPDYFMTRGREQDLPLITKYADDIESKPEPTFVLNELALEKASTAFCLKYGFSPSPGVEKAAADRVVFSSGMAIKDNYIEGQISDLVSMYQTEVARGPYKTHGDIGAQ